MEEPLEQIDHIDQEKPDSSRDDRYYQHLKHTEIARQHSRQEMWELYEELQAHHFVVQTRYEALDKALRDGQETKVLWHEYREAVTAHRLLVNRFRLAMQQRLVDLFHKQGQDRQS